MSIGINTNYSNYYNSTTRIKQTAHNSQTLESNETKTDGTAERKDYFNELKEKYSSLNFTTGNSLKGASGTGMGNVMLHPNLLKKMENDPELAAKIENDIKYIPQAESWLKSMTASGGGRLKASGCFIDENGNMSSWSVAEYGATKEQVKKEEENELRKKIAELKSEQSKTAMDKLMASRTEQRKQLEGLSQISRIDLTSTANSNVTYQAHTASNNKS